MTGEIAASPVLTGLGLGVRTQRGRFYLERRYGAGGACWAQEALFHYFGLSLGVIVEPSEWYACHRKPTLVDASPDRTRVLVRFGAMSP
jgi:hypothetical protein